MSITRIALNFLVAVSAISFGVLAAPQAAYACKNGGESCSTNADCCNNYCTYAGTCSYSHSAEHSAGLVLRAPVRSNFDRDHQSSPTGSALHQSNAGQHARTTGSKADTQKENNAAPRLGIE